LDKLGKHFPADLKEFFSIIYVESVSFVIKYQKYKEKENEFLLKSKKEFLSSLMSELQDKSRIINHTNFKQ